MVYPVFYYLLCYICILTTPRVNMCALGGSASSSDGKLPDLDYVAHLLHAFILNDVILYFGQGEGQGRGLNSFFHCYCF